MKKVSRKKKAITYKEKLFFDGDSYFDDLINEIGKAKKTIHIETYIFNKDIIGKKIAAALIDASERGVDVKILVDGYGSQHWGDSFTKKMEKSGVKTRIFHPIPWRHWQLHRSAVQLPFIQKVIHLFLNLNARNHRKIFIIDEHTVYLGSMNISKTHLSNNNHGDNWRDTAVKLEDVNCRTLSNSFANTWEHKPLPERLQDMFKHVKVNNRFRLNQNRHRRRVLYKNLLKRIGRSKKRIWITNAYFVPDNFLLKKLKDAASKGIDVRILLPSKSDVIVMPWTSSAFYRSLLESGARVFEYKPNILHAKTLLIDNWAMVGSSNLNYRSLLRDLEVDVVLKLKKSIETIEKQFLKDLKQTQEIRLSQWISRPIYQRLISRILLYLKYWIL